MLSAVIDVLKAYREGLRYFTTCYLRPVRGDKMILKKSGNISSSTTNEPLIWGSFLAERIMSPNFQEYTQTPQSVRHIHVCSLTGWICVHNLCVCLCQKCYNIRHMGLVLVKLATPANLWWEANPEN